MTIRYGPYEREVEFDDISSSVGPGWMYLLRFVFNMCERYDIPIAQIKEKWAGLRIYLGPAPDWMWDLIVSIEHASKNICEFCGERGELHTSSTGWYKTVCKICASEKSFSLANNKNREED